MTQTRTPKPQPQAPDAANRLYDTVNVSRGEMTAQAVQDAAAALQDSFNRIAHTALSKESKQS